MLVEIKDVLLSNVWQESFKDRQTGEDVEFCRAMLQATGEPPMQLGVAKEDFEGLKANIGAVGVATVEIDAQPNLSLIHI